jgi:uncharacterized protein (DUF1015 family)
MVSLIPFQGYHYNTKEIKDMGKVIAPPYDQISLQMQDDFCASSPYNFVRLIFGKVFSDDTEKENRYTRADQMMRKWIQEGVLVQDKEPSFYLYRQRFKLYGQWFERAGLVGLMRLEPFGKGVFPHEKTFPKPKEDRFKLMKTCRTNFEHVFFLYDDPDRYLEKFLEKCAGEPLFLCTDPSDTSHSIFKLSKTEVLNQVVDFFKDKNLLIADGHHRYETSLLYQQEMRSVFCSSSDDSAPFNFRLGTFVSLQNKGLKILPTHRVLKNLNEIQRRLLKERLPDYFDMRKVDSLQEALEGIERQSFSFGLADKDDFFVLNLKTSVDLKKEFPEIPPVLVELDVFVLHSLIFNRILQIQPEKSDEWINYIRWPQDVLKEIKEDPHKLAFFLNPVKPNQVRKVAESGEKMPHKSTDFYPKLWSGLVFYKMEF